MVGITQATAAANGGTCSPSGSEYQWGLSATSTPETRALLVTTMYRWMTNLLLPRIRLIVLCWRKLRNKWISIHCWVLPPLQLCYLRRTILWLLAHKAVRYEQHPQKYLILQCCLHASLLKCAVNDVFHETEYKEKKKSMRDNSYTFWRPYTICSSQR